MKNELLICAVSVLAMAATSLGKPLVDEKFTAPKNAVILVIRHAEKPDTGESLSAAGEAHARAYVSYFQNFTIDGQPLKLDYLFATTDSSNSHRPRLTLEPIAKALGIKIDRQFNNNQFQLLAQELQTHLPGTNILICWHHGQIPQLLRALSADPEKLLPNGKWPDDEFGWLIQLRYDENGRLFESKRIAENLPPDNPAKPASTTP